MKKLFAVLLTLVLALSIGTLSLAAEGTGTIKINNAFEGATYKIYKILDFEPVKDSTTQGRYSVTTGWDAFLTGTGAEYLEANTALGTIQWKGEETAERKATFAKAAIAYAKTNSIAVAGTATADADGVVEFEGVALGYYAIDTSLGTICALTNVDNTFEAHEKNAKPDIDKYVQEDSEITNADEGWGKVNDADIDQAVNYKSTITVGYGVTNYVMHDTMEAGLTFNNDVAVKLADGTEVAAENYTVTYPATDGHTFDVAFNDTFIAGLAKGTTFTVYYSATLNENANIVTDGNDNTVYLSYGEDSTWETAEHKTSTYTWKLDVLKYTQDGGNKVSLAGAKFELRTNSDTVIELSEVAGTAVPTYKVDVEGTITTITTDANGKFEIVGLDEGTYKLHETEAPVGYNKPATDTTIIITSEYDETALTASYEINDKAPATIEVENKTGVLLPETGGIGTKIFYIIGSLLMVTAAVLLVSKKRMSNFI